MSYSNTRQWIKHSHHPVARRLFCWIKALRQLEVSYPKMISRWLYFCYRYITVFLQSLARLFFWTPILKGRLQKTGKRLYLYGGLPYIAGPLSIHIGDDCRLSGHTTFTGRSSSQPTPLLIVGNNVDIGWMTTIAVGQQVQIGNNVRIAGRAFLAGYPGHPVNKNHRAAGLPDTEEQVGDIVLKDDVWLATGVSVMAGVTIGEGSIIAAGSVVTHDIPANVLAGGVPARVIRPLPEESV